MGNKVPFRRWSGHLERMRKEILAKRTYEAEVYTDKRSGRKGKR